MIDPRPLPFALLAGLCLACAPPSGGSHAPRTDGHAHHGALQYTLDGAALADGPIALAGPGAMPIHQIGVRFDARAPGERVMLAVEPIRGGATGDAAPMTVTWREGGLGVARLILERPADAVKLSAAGVAGAVVEIYPEVLARPDAPLTRNLPGEGARGAPKQARGPAGTISREQWGARSPGLICSNIVDPYRMSIHHTASPADDGPGGASRMRQMQAFHIDSRGWCDIGYHFVVSQAGELFEGRRDERRPAAHVGGQNAGNVGISLIGNFEEQPLLDTQFETTVNIVRWVSQTHGIPLNRDSVKGHREWPGQQTSCPGANLLAAFGRILAAAGGDGPAPDPEPDPEPEPPGDPGTTAVRIEWMDGVGDAPGTFPGLVDAPTGSTFRVGLRLHNGAGQALRGVRLGFEFDPALEPVDYVIQTDHPARDGMTWMINDADGAPENPPKDAMGRAGELTMYAFGAGETKRVVIELRGTGAAFDPSAFVRAWAANVDGFHAQAGWRPGEADRWQAEGVVALQARDHWLFDHEREPEGWRACAEGGVVGWSARLDGSLGMGAGCAASPPWTRIDADAWPELTLWMNAPPGAHRARLIWRGAEGEAGAQWELFGGAEVRAEVLDLSSHPAWRGVVDGLWLHLDGAADDELYRVGAIYLQSPVDRVTNAPDQPLPRDPPVAWEAVEADEIPPTPEPAPDPEPEPEPGAPEPGPDPEGDPGEPEPAEPEPDPGPLPDGGVGSAGQVAEDGCAAAPGSDDGRGVLGLALLALLAARRRRA